MRGSNWQQWYSALIKPDWTPSGQVIGIIWSSYISFDSF